MNKYMLKIFHFLYKKINNKAVHLTHHPQIILQTLASIESEENIYDDLKNHLKQFIKTYRIVDILHIDKSVYIYTNAVGTCIGYEGEKIKEWRSVLFKEHGVYNIYLIHSHFFNICY